MVDAIILGGGPAGASAAKLLSRLGHRVTVLSRPARHTLGESIPPSSRRLLEELELRQAVEAGSFYRSRGNTVWWGDEVRVEPFPTDELGWQVERHEFDRVLLDASAEGVTKADLHRAATVREVVTGADESEVRYEVDGQVATSRARWVLDCTGRAGILARRVGRNSGPGQTTFALHAVWHSYAWDLPDETHTLVESYRDGWGWSVPVSPNVRYVTAMVDAELSRPAAGQLFQETYFAEFQKAKQLGRLLSGARMLREPQGLSAAPYQCAQSAGPGWLLVGDASSFIDPLSSYGVKKALASGWLAAVVVHSCLTEPSVQSAALDLFQTREREVYQLLSRQAADMFAQGGAAHQHEFWWSRANQQGEASVEPDIESLRRDPQVLAAFEQLKLAAGLRLQPAAAIRIVQRPLVREHHVVLEDHLVSAWSPTGIRYLRSISLPRVVELAPRCAQVPDLYERYVELEGPTPLPDFLGVLSVLVAKGVMVQE